VKFQVFKNGKLVDKFTLCGAYLFGTDGISIRRAKISFKKGVVHCEKPNMETAGLALLWPVEGFGRVLLSTTCLPERKEPYILNVEIARAKLMQIINKREEWSFFTDIEGLGDTPLEARTLFIKAVQNLSDASLSSKLADEALKKALIYSEKLAGKQADVLFEMRSRNHGFGRGCLGCRIDPEQITNPRYVEKILKNFSLAMIPLSWGRVEPEQGRYDYSLLDACVNVLSKKRLVLAAGPLLRFSPEYLPKWLLESGLDFEDIRDLAYQFVLKTVSRYDSSVRAWRAVSGLNAWNHFGFNFEQVLEMTRAATMAVKGAGERLLKIVELTNPWGEYYATVSNTIPPLVYMDMVVQSGINLDAFGLELRFGKNEAGMHVRDMLEISAILDYFGYVAKPLYITEVEVPSEAGCDSCSGDVAGVWRGEWDRQLQGQWVEQFYKIALSKPFIDCVSYSNLADTPRAVIANSGLLTAALEPKESFVRLIKLRERIFRDGDKRQG